MQAAPHSFIRARAEAATQNLEVGRPSSSRLGPESSALVTRTVPGTRRVRYGTQIYTCRPTTLRRECLDHLIVLDEQHLRSVLAEYVAYYNRERPHRTLGLQTPEPRPRPMTGAIRSRPVLNGLHHLYERAA